MSQTLVIIIAVFDAAVVQWLVRLPAGHVFKSPSRQEITWAPKLTQSKIGTEDVTESKGSHHDTNQQHPSRADRSKNMRLTPYTQYTYWCVKTSFTISFSFFYCNVLVI